MAHQKRSKRAFAVFLALTLMAVWLTSMLFSTAVYADEEKNGTINGVDDLIGKTIGVQLGTTGDTFATDYEKDGTARIERYNKAADAVQALKQNKIDCVIIDEQPALSFTAVNDDITILDEEFAVEEYALCVKKGSSELLSKINAALKKLKDDGTIDKINTNYIGTDEEKGTVTGGGKYVEGTLVTLTAKPNEGYQFVSWSDETTENPYVFASTNHVTLTATFAPKSYNMTFVLDNGSNDVVIPQLYNTALTEPDDVKKEGFTFKGWNPALPEKVPATDMTFTAIWERNNYKLTWVVDGVSTEVDDEEE